MKKARRLTAAAVALTLLLALAAAVPASATDGLYVKAGAPTALETTEGATLTLDQTEIFADSSGHSLNYSMSAAGTGEHTKVSGSTFYFSEKTAGTYDITLSAACASHGTVSHSLTVTVKSGEHGLDIQYNYDETPADSVTVFVTLSSDGVPLRADNGLALAHLEVTVPYFDLALYGLEDYYRYHTENGEGEYVDFEVVERPTALHLYIYLLERYFMGLPDSECCKGTSGVMEYVKNDTLYNIWDGEAYYAENMAFSLSGGATSMYMTNFWGHDENLMYFRNHAYPYQSSGWGSTADYILLSAGDTADVALFSNWEFWTMGSFASFYQETYTATEGESFVAETRGFGTSAMMETPTFEDLDADQLVFNIYNEDGTLYAEDVGEISGNEVTVRAPDEAGVYILVGCDANGGSSDACIAPATARLVVTDASAPQPAVVYGDADGNGAVEVADVQLISRYLLGQATLDADALTVADVDGNGAVEVADLHLICQFILGNIAMFPVEVVT